MVQHASDVMRHRRHRFTTPGGGKLGKYKVHHGAPHIGKRIAVEEEEGSAAMALPQEFYGFVEGGDFSLPSPPLCFKRSIAL